ncbi:uncharacterized protein [Apostichopus japonicus]|uniref:uncharacterized protein n=1 Tax=Stichopus japonicus TaxID=307972 RepID=UPI003AB404DC
MSQSQDIIKGFVKENIGKAQEWQKKNFDKRQQSKQSFKVGSISVLVRNTRKDARRGGKLENSWLGPYGVKAVNEKGLYTHINSSTGLPLKKKFNPFYLKNFTQELAASIISTNTPDEEKSNPVIVKLLCSIIQHYDGHSSELME